MSPYRTGDPQRDSLLMDLYEIQVIAENLLSEGHPKEELRFIREQVIGMQHYVKNEGWIAKGHFNVTLNTITLKGKLFQIRRTNSA